MSFTNFKQIAASKNQLIKFFHVATGKKVSFPAFLTEYSDGYSVSWGEQSVYGRNDPVKPYQSTTRSISLAFDVLSHDIENAKENLGNYSLLTKMLYPVYSVPLNGEDTGAALGRTIKAPPLMKIKFVNFIQSANGESSLLGCVDGFTFQPDQAAGFFVSPNGDLWPKIFNISFKFTPQHEQPLGWDNSSREFMTDNFPYSAPFGSSVTGTGIRDTGNSEIIAHNQKTVLKG